jgi:tripartite-type tricarboxylate transporter receptor subunit TctC
MATEEAQRTLGALGGEVMATTPAQFAEHISAEIVRWRDLVNRMNLRVKA